MSILSRESSRLPPRARRLPAPATAGMVPLPPVSVLLCGEQLRGDDAAAFAVSPLLSDLIAARLPDADRDRVAIMPAGQLDLLVLLGLPAGAPCVVVDAVAGPPPGTIVVRPLAELAAGLRDGVAPRSSHELPIDQVLALAAALRPGGLAGWFVGLAGDSWDLGASLSAPVAAALPALAEAVVQAVAGCAQRVP